MQPAQTRIVRCCHCHRMMRVSGKALSVFCPHCQKRVTLEDLRIVGTLPGKQLDTCGDILVEPSSQLNLDINANNVIVRGRVNGNIRANESIIVASTGRVIGDVKSPKIIVRDGGVIQGRCEMTRVAPPLPAAVFEQNAATEDNETATSQTVSVSAESFRPMPPPPRQIRPVRLD